MSSNELLMLLQLEIVDVLKLNIRLVARRLRARTRCTGDLPRGTAVV